MPLLLPQPLRDKIKATATVLMCVFALLAAGCAVVANTISTSGPLLLALSWTLLILALVPATIIVAIELLQRAGLSEVNDDPDDRPVG